MRDEKNKYVVFRKWLWCQTVLLFVGSLFWGCFDSPTLGGFRCETDRDCYKLSCQGGFCGGLPEQAKGDGGESAQPDLLEPVSDQELVIEAPVEARKEAVPERDPDEPSCATGTSLCAGQCVDTKQDNGHCGVCGNKCAPGQACRLGECEGKFDYHSCDPRNPVCNVALYGCLNIDPGAGSEDFRCLQKCKADTDCPKSHKCSSIKGQEKVCFRSCAQDCHILQDSTLYCSASGTCLSRSCTMAALDCGSAAAYHCANFGQPNGSTAFRCFRSCKNFNDCPSGHLCLCEQGRDCKTNETGTCFLQCDQGSECSRVDRTTTCTTVQQNKLCLKQP